MTEYNFERQQGETPFRQLKRISIDKLNKLHSMDWLDVKEQFGFEHSAETLRKYAGGWKLESEYEEIEEASNTENEPLIKYKETTEILGDGTQKSDKLISMSNEQSKDVNYLLQAHGFDTTEWELISARNNIWNVSSKTQGVQTLYSSKISVKPKGKNGFNMEKLLETIKRDVKPVVVERPLETGDKLLEIPLFDMHFGIADFDYYISTYQKVANKIKSIKWNTVVFVIGQDLLHNDGFTGKTTSGTFIEKVNTEKAWDDAYLFYLGLINFALGSSNNVHVIYSCGNHDQGISFGFVKTLEAKFPQVTFDTAMKQRKGYTWNNIFLGFSHGDKGANRLGKNFLTEHGASIAKAKIVEIHSGHIHHEVTKDDFGIVVRALATGAKTDDWHDDNGFIGAMKRFEIFEYSKDALDGIDFV